MTKSPWQRFWTAFLGVKGVVMYSTKMCDNGNHFFKYQSVFGIGQAHVQTVDFIAAQTGQSCPPQHRNTSYPTNGISTISGEFRELSTAMHNIHVRTMIRVFRTFSGTLHRAILLSCRLNAVPVLLLLCQAYSGNAYSRRTCHK